MTVVIDVGCAKYGGDESIPYLIEEFRPERLLGFDPGAQPASYRVGDTHVVVSNMAAWTHDGTVSFAGNGLRGHVEEVVTSPAARTVACFDLARWIDSLDDSRIVLKLDAEGAEYVLLPHLIEHGVDELLELAWIEWHCPVCGTGWFGNETPDACQRCGHIERGRRSELEKLLGCEIAQWNR